MHKVKESKCLLERRCKILCAQTLALSPPWIFKVVITNTQVFPNMRHVHPPSSPIRYTKRLSCREEGYSSLSCSYGRVEDVSQIESCLPNKQQHIWRNRRTGQFEVSTSSVGSSQPISSSSSSWVSFLSSLSSSLAIVSVVVCRSSAVDVVSSTSLFLPIWASFSFCKIAYD